MTEAMDAMHPAATDPLPFFMPPPGAPDLLFAATLAILLGAIFGAGLLYLRLHALPEHMAHGASKVQFQLVGVLALLALFTHNHVFWVAALLLALIQFPDLTTPLNAMAGSLARLAGPEPAPLVAFESTRPPAPRPAPDIPPAAAPAPDPAGEVPSAGSERSA